MQRLTGMEWLKKHIGKLEVTNSEFKEKIEEIKNIHPEVYNEFKELTPLKLVLLNYALDTCTTIIKNNRLFTHMYYVDLFAGSGINKIKKDNNFLTGSPLIALLKYGEYYNSMFFYENDQKFFIALQKRLNSLKKKNLEIIPKDCNSSLDKIMSKVNKPNTYTFFFVDPFSTEFHWDSMKKILNMSDDGPVARDIVFTFMRKVIIRFVGLAQKEMSEGKQLTKFFGDESWKKIRNTDDCVELYKKNILKEIPQTVIKIIMIRSKKYGFCYHLFFITNKTKKGNPWLQSIEKARKEIESNSDKSVEMALNIIKNRQATLSKF